MGEIFRDKSCQTYTIMPQALSKAIPNSILLPDAPLSYNTLQHIIMEDDYWKILDHILCIQAARLGGKLEYL